MTIHESIKTGIPDALRAKDTVRLTTLRSLLTAFTNETVAKKRKPDVLLSDDEALSVLKRSANQRKDAITQYEQGNRPELANIEKEELIIIESFLPAQLSREEIEKVVKAKIAESGNIQKADIGRLIGAVMQEIKGQADGATIKAIVEETLV